MYVCIYTYIFVYHQLSLEDREIVGPSCPAQSAAQTEGSFSFDGRGGGGRVGAAKSEKEGI